MKKNKTARKISMKLIAALFAVCMLTGQTVSAYADESISESEVYGESNFDVNETETHEESDSDMNETVAYEENNSDMNETAEVENSFPDGMNDDPEAYREEQKQATITDDYGIAPFALEDNMDIAGYGIDVSQHNGIIDWQKVRKSGVEFALIRLQRLGTKRDIGRGQ